MAIPCEKLLNSSSIQLLFKAPMMGLYNNLPAFPFAIANPFVHLVNQMMLARKIPLVPMKQHSLLSLREFVIVCRVLILFSFWSNWIIQMPCILFIYYVFHDFLITDILFYNFNFEPSAHPQQILACAHDHGVLLNTFQLPTGCFTTLVCFKPDGFKAGTNLEVCKMITLNYLWRNYPILDFGVKFDVFSKQLCLDNPCCVTIFRENFNCKVRVSSTVVWETNPVFFQKY